MIERDADTCEGLDDLIPRVILLTLAEAGQSCSENYCECLAALEFVTEVIPRTPCEHSPSRRKEARSRGEKLLPYSAMAARRLGPPPAAEGATEAGSGRSYHFSFFQRRHRRRQKQPRKADGVQVIRVAPCQKLQHLPLREQAPLKVTKVVR